MELITPGIGLIFWKTLAFALVLYILRKYAWIPILGNIKEREQLINNGIRDGKRMQRELAQMDETKEKILHQAREEANSIVKNAKSEGEQIIRKARDQAHEEAENVIENTKSKINAEKKAAEREIRQQIILLSVDMAQSVLQEELSDKEKKSNYVRKLLDDIQLN